MTTKIKLYIGRKILESMRKKNKVTALNFKSLIEVDNSQNIQMNISLNHLENYIGVSNIGEILKIKPDDIIESVHMVKDRANRKVCFQINKNLFIKEIIEHITDPEVNKDKKKIVVEYSSPNIAKPFHVGHLRSTIIGNFIANLNSYLNDDVVRLNYLGDWGTQFGLIKVGVEELHYKPEDIQNNPLQLLYESYVYANKLAEKDPLITERARKEFSKLESGSEEDINNWKTYVNFTISELETVYHRLGIKFDEYNYESMYSAKQISEVVDHLNKMKVLKTQPDGKKVAIINDRNVTVIKSDGTTLYLTRDIAAAIDRFKKYQFDRMYYVVENGQNDHFNALQSILYQLDMPWAHRIKHVKFGRIHGMSTRKGSVVFLKDILDETRDLMIKCQIESPTTKAPINDSVTSDILGVSCVIVNDLKQRRQRDYNFSWDRVLQVHGDGGIKLQYTHCRLCSLEKNSGATAAKECKPLLLQEPVVIDLVKELGKFHDVINKAEAQLEATVLVTYLFRLCNHISKALATLQVKNQDPELASQRLLLFNQAREILRQGMTILGLQPLIEM